MNGKVIVRLVLVLGMVTLPGCGPAPTTTPTAPAPTLRAPATSPPTETAAATVTPAPTYSPPPTETPLPTPTPTPPPTPVVVSLESADQVAELGCLGNGRPTQLAISPDGRMIAVGSSQGIWMVDAASLEPTRLLRGHAGAVTALDWSPDGAYLVSGGQDGNVFIWDALSGRLLLPLPPLVVHQAEVSGVAWSPDGTRIASGHRTGTSIWRAEDGAQLFFLEARELASVKWVDWSPDGGRLASLDYDGWLQVWDATSGREVYSFATSGRTISLGVAWSPDGSRIATSHFDASSSGSQQGWVRLWDASSGALLQTFTAISHLYGLAWSPDGSLLVAGSSWANLELWETVTWQPLVFVEYSHAIPFLSEGDLIGLSWSPEGTCLATFGADGMLRIWGVPPSVGPLGPIGVTSRGLPWQWWCGAMLL